MNESYTVTGNASHEVSFSARNIFVQNNTGQIVYVRIGTQQIPDSLSNDLAIFPFMQVSQPIDPTRFFGFSFGSKFQPTATAQGGQVVVTFDTEPRQPFSNNITSLGGTFQLVQAISTATIASDTPIVLVAAVTGKSIQVFRVRATLYHAASAPQLHQWYSSTIAEITGNAGVLFQDGWTTTGYALVEGIFEGGLILPLGKPISYLHSDTNPTNLAPTVTALYQYI